MVLRKLIQVQRPQKYILRGASLKPRLIRSVQMKICSKSWSGIFVMFFLSKTNKRFFWTLKASISTTTGPILKSLATKCIYASRYVDWFFENPDLLHPNFRRRFWACSERQIKCKHPSGNPLVFPWLQMAGGFLFSAIWPVDQMEKYDMEPWRRHWTARIGKPFGKTRLSIFHIRDLLSLRTGPERFVVNCADKIKQSTVYFWCLGLQCPS